MRKHTDTRKGDGPDVPVFVDCFHQFLDREAQRLMNETAKRKPDAKA